MSRLTLPFPPRPCWVLTLLLGLATLCLWPTFQIGYVSDDATSSLLPGVLRVEDLSLTEYISLVLANCLRAGRFYPLQLVYLHSWFAFVQSTAIHKAMVIALIDLDLLLFYGLVHRVSKNAGLALLASALVIPLFQFRIGFDPILSFFGLFPLIVAGLLGSAVPSPSGLSRLQNRTRWWVLSAAVYVATLLLYELTFPLFLLHLALIAFSSLDRRGKIRTAAPFVLAALAALFTTMILRRISPFTDPAALELRRINLDVGAVLLTWARHTSAALPLSYFILDSERLYPRLWRIGPVIRLAVSGFGWIVLAVALATAFWAFRLVRKDDEHTVGRVRPLVLTGLILLIIPPALVCISARHQTFISWGVGYTPVYIQYFGVALLIASALWSLRHMYSGRLTAFGLAVGIAGLTALSYRANVAIINFLEPRDGRPSFNRAHQGFYAFEANQRRNLEAALRAGLVDSVPEYAVVHLANEYLGWYDHGNSSYFFAKYSGKTLRTYPLPNEYGPCEGWFARKRTLHGLPPAPEIPPYFVRAFAWDRSEGYVILSQPEAKRRNDEIRVFVRRPRLYRGSKLVPFYLFGSAIVNAKGNPDGKVLVCSWDLKMIRHGQDWGIFSLRSHHEADIAPEDITLLLGPPSHAMDTNPAPAIATAPGSTSVR